MHMPIPFRVTAEPAVAVHEDSLEAQLNPLPETNLDSTQLSVLVLRRIRILGHVVDRNLVLEDDNGGAEECYQGACQATNVAQELEDAVDFAPDRGEVAIELVAHHDLNLIWEVPHAES